MEFISIPHMWADEDRNEAKQNKDGVVKYLIKETKTGSPQGG